MRRVFTNSCVYDLVVQGGFLKMSYFGVEYGHFRAFLGQKRDLGTFLGQNGILGHFEG